MQMGALNRRAQQRYGSFVSALDLIAEVLGEVDKLIGKHDEKKMTESWTIASKEDLKGLRKRAFEELDHLRTLGKKHEAELVSRDWRF